MHLLKSERAAITGVRWAMSPSCPQRTPKAQILALPLNEYAYSSLERERIPIYHSVKGNTGETLSIICMCNTNGSPETHLSHKLQSVGGELVVVTWCVCWVCVFYYLLWLLPLLGSDERLNHFRVSDGLKCVGVIITGQTGWAQSKWMRRSALRISRRGCVWSWKTRL